jgi:hypothetical protein
MTGLKDQYDVDLQWMPDTNATPPVESEDMTPSLFAALGAAWPR